MFKDVFKVRKTSYHVRMMKYLWNLDYYDFSHMCPYWWLSVFNHIIILPCLLIHQAWRLIKTILKMLWEWVETGFEILDDYLTRVENEKYRKSYQYFQEHPEELLELKEKARQKLFEKTKKLIGWDGYYKLDSAYTHLSFKVSQKEIEEQERLEREKKLQKFLTVCKEPEKDKLIETNKFEAYLVSYERQKEMEATRLRAERIKRNKQRINKILKIVKPIMTMLAYTLGTLIGLTAVYYIFNAIVWLVKWFGDVKHTSYVSLGIGLLWVIGVIVGLIIVVLLLIGIIKFFQHNNIRIRLPKFKFIGTFFWVLAFPFVYLWKKALGPVFRWIWNAILFLIQMAKNECPAIDWVD